MVPKNKKKKVFQKKKKKFSKNTNFARPKNLYVDISFSFKDRALKLGQNIVNICGYGMN